MKLAIVTVIRESVEEAIARLQEADVEAFETSYEYFLNADARTLRETGRLFCDSGIQPWSVHAPFGKGFNLSVIDNEERKQALAIHEKLLPRFALAGIKVVVVHPGVGTNNAEEMSTMNSLVVESLAQLAPIAEQVGVKLGLENMLPRHPGSEGADLRQMVEQINSPSLGVCFDSGHAHVAGDMRAQFEELKDLIITFHIQDNDGTRDMHLQPGYGTTNWQDFSEVLESMNFTSPIVIEARPWGGVSHAWMLKEVYALLKGDQLKLSDFGIEDDAGDLTARCPECGHLVFGAPDDWFCRCKE